jgi:hypothetical protein
MGLAGQACAMADEAPKRSITNEAHVIDFQFLQRIFSPSFNLFHRQLSDDLNSHEHATFDDLVDTPESYVDSIKIS